MEMIKVKDVSFGYSSEDTIKNINLTISQGDFVCIVGENGSGKSTLIKCILGLNSGYKGEINVNSKVSYLPQMTEVQNNFPASIEEVVLSGTISNNINKIFYNKKDRQIANDIMKNLSLYDVRKKCFRELSGGQKQRTLIARALCSISQILILDEPVNGLDPNITLQTYEMLKELNKKENLTIVMVSHDTLRALDYANKVIEISKGEITFNGTPSKYNEGGKK